MITKQQLANILVSQLRDDETWDDHVRLTTQVLEGPHAPWCPHLLVMLTDNTNYDRYFDFGPYNHAD